ncbi:uncharacterized protein MELLADRAFT_76888 [Melampsora larici-populina 98AG31]|uniref:PIN domain-containing protein n=1 Tax=Melampsora larici-populina (strain 98AG31 / pathotype 3-4-7) TaxID=747676 RepID=F4R9Y4_MELLP|nr:uncharacterized protein MELLADRAFT_76888 [Melampsora larici-populina 98AG31]EGG10614.1 hypothetical protein MELLADRAFT_76888 [Melampsora larici-populina 98AG31]
MSSPSPLSQSTLPQSNTSLTPNKPPSTSNKPKDGARTLVDALTAYQRRNARPRAERNQVQTSSQSANPSPSPNNLSPRPNRSDSNNDDNADNKANPTTPDRHRLAPSSARSRNHHVSEFSRNLNPDQEVQLNKNTDNRGRLNGTRFKSSHKTTAGGVVGGRSPSNNLPSSKLYDPNSSSHPPARIFGDSGRLPISANTRPHSHRLVSSKYETTTAPGGSNTQSSVKPGHEREGPSAVRPHSSQPIKKSTMAMDADLTGHERWKTKKPIRGDSSITAGANGAPRQLFDPRKHDPVKFSAANRPIETGAANGLSDNRDSATAGSGLATAGAHEDNGHGSHLDQGGKPTSTIVQLKRAYKYIVCLETALKEEEFASKAKEEETKTREINSAQDGRHKLLEDDYWVKLAKQHREFVGVSLIVSYRFHQLLERLRHALPSNSGQSSNHHLLEHMTDFIYFAYGFYTNLLEEQSFGSFRSIWIEQLGDLARYRMAVAGLMTKLTSNHQHSKNIANEMTSEVHASDTDFSDADDQVAGKAMRRKRRGRRRKEGSQSDHSMADSLDLASDSHHSRSSDEEDTRLSPAPIKPKAVPVTPKIMRGSIGVAALGDWEFEEQEIWRATAKDWYSKGLAESPGTGRLHHHLALLSKGDELRTLYHYTKRMSYSAVLNYAIFDLGEDSLTASHPYLPARESILPFFESEHQSRRTRPEVSINDLFVHLHGMLFTKIQLDDFHEELARFMEKLTEDRVLSERHHRVSDFDRLPTVVAKPVMSDASWVMMATINICALLQYGADDGVIRVNQSFRQKSGTDMGSRHLGGKRAVGKMTASTGKTLMIAPQAILVNHSSNTPPSVMPDSLNLRRPSQSISSDDGMLASSVDQHSDTFSHTDSQPNHEDEVMNSTTLIEDQMRSIKVKSDHQEVDDEGGPIVFTLAAKLSFDMLSDALQPNLYRLCPYVTLILTFLGSMSHNSTLMRKLEKFIPWMRLQELFNSIPESIELKSTSNESSTHSSTGGVFKLIGHPLPEDWCLRGMEWTNKTLFGRGYWKPSKEVDGHNNESFQPVNRNSEPESEMDVLLSFSSCEAERSPDPSSDPTRSLSCASYEMDMDDELNPDDKESQESKASRDARWKRISLVAVWISKSIPGFGFDPTMPTHSRFAILKSLRNKIHEWDSERLFDTNILIGMLSIMKDLLESEQWTMIIPLVVITELDGLKKGNQSNGSQSTHHQNHNNKDRLSSDATEAIKYLESSIKTKSRWLKIQTSKGNYLRDLSIRNEKINFQDPHQHHSNYNQVGFSTDHAYNLDDLVLRATMWQIEHFNHSSIKSNQNQKTEEEIVEEDQQKAEKVVLVTLDRNLRLKARARGILAANENQIIGLVELSKQTQLGG